MECALWDLLEGTLANERRITRGIRIWLAIRECGHDPEYLVHLPKRIYDEVRHIKRCAVDMLQDIAEREMRERG